MGLPTGRRVSMSFGTAASAPMRTSARVQLFDALARRTLR